MACASLLGQIDVALFECRAHRGLPVEFLLLRYSDLFTVEALSLLCLLVISWFICSRRWCIDKLGVFHANQISICLDPHLNWGWGWPRETGLSPPVKYFTDRSKAVLLLWIFYVFSVLCLLCLYMCLVVTCWERADLLALVCGVQLWVCHFPNDILGHVWYLILSISNLCTLTYFDKHQNFDFFLITDFLWFFLKSQISAFSGIFENHQLPKCEKASENECYIFILLLHSFCCTVTRSLQNMKPMQKCRFSYFVYLTSWITISKI